LVRVFKLKAFARDQRREGIRDEALAAAVRGAERGLVDADLGGGLIKQRVALSGQGKRGGYRTVIAYRRGERAVFLYVFPKSGRDNIDDDELRTWRQIGQVYMTFDANGLEAAIAAKELTEVSLWQNRLRRSSRRAARRACAPRSSRRCAG
jgi:hypothetical protein